MGGLPELRRCGACLGEPFLHQITAAARLLIPLLLLLLLMLRVFAGAGDETLRFWNVFPGPKAQGAGSDSGMGSMMRTLIR